MLNHKGLAKDHLGQVLSRPVIRGVQGAKPPLEKFSLPLEKCVGHSLKMLDIVQKIWALSENSSPLLVSQAGYGHGSQPALLLTQTKF